jgi:hypothetical protein
VPLYVLKTFNPSGRLIGRVEFRSGADDEAVAALLYLNEERSSELWCGSRLVTTWHGEKSGRTASEPRRRAGRPRSSGVEATRESSL